MDEKMLERKKEVDGFEYPELKIGSEKEEFDWHLNMINSGIVIKDPTRFARKFSRMDRDIDEKRYEKRKIKDESEKKRIRLNVWKTWGSNVSSSIKRAFGGR